MKLFRHFMQEDHLKDFLNGKIRFSKISLYKQPSYGSRSDWQEGIGISSHDGYEKKTELHNDVFILSTTTECESSYCKEQFGNYYATINDSETFLIKLNTAIEQHPFRFFGKIQSELVQYTKGERQPEEVNAISSIYQKGIEYTQEKEYRYFAIAKENSCTKHVHIEINNSDRLIS